MVTPLNETSSLVRRKEAPEKKQMTDTVQREETKRVQLSLVIDPDLRDRLAIAVDLSGTSQREYVTAAIEHYIAHSGDADRIQAIYDIRKGN